MDEHPHGALGPAEDAGDLRRAHLVDEAQRERRGAGRRAAPGGRAAPRRPRRGSRPRPRGRCRRRWRGPHRAPPRAMRRAGAGGVRRSLATMLRAIRNSQTRKVDASGPSSGVRLLAEPRQRGEGAQERALGGVLGGVVVRELVEGVGIHLGEVLPIQGVELGRVPAGRLDEGAVAVEGDDAARSNPPAFQTPDEPSRYTDAGERRTRTTSPASTATLPARGRRVLDDERAAGGVDAQRLDGRSRVARALERRPGARSSPGGRPSAPTSKNPARSASTRPSSRSRNPARSASRSIGRPPDASRRLVIDGRELGREVGRRPVRR